MACGTHEYCMTTFQQWQEQRDIFQLHQVAALLRIIIDHAKACGMPEHQATSMFAELVDCLTWKCVPEVIKDVQRWCKELPDILDNGE
jgi:hypothetical protein